VDKALSDILSCYPVEDSPAAAGVAPAGGDCDGGGGGGAQPPPATALEKAYAEYGRVLGEGGTLLVLSGRELDAVRATCATLLQPSSWTVEVMQLGFLEWPPPPPPPPPPPLDGAEEGAPPPPPPRAVRSALVARRRTHAMDGYGAEEYGCSNGTGAGGESESKGGEAGERRDREAEARSSLQLATDIAALRMQMADEPWLEHAARSTVGLRRSSTGVDGDYSSSSDDDDSDEYPLTALELRVEDVKIELRKLYNREASLCGRYLVPAYWRALMAGTGLTLSEGDPLLVPHRHSAAAAPASSVAAARGTISEQGHCVISDIEYGAGGQRAVDFAALREGANRLKAAGWPAAFLILFDEVWQLVDSLFGVMGPVLSDDGTGEGLELDTDLFVWALDKGVTDGQYVNGNFSRPHRDSNHTGSNDAEGNPVKLSVWVPLSDATLDNGCMYVLPKNCDELFDQPHHPQHMTAAKLTEDEELICCFPLQHARPLPAPAGSICSWQGNLIHWGSSCAPHRNLEQPRMSMALTLRKREFHSADAGITACCGRDPIPRAKLREMDFPTRLSVVGKSLIMYYHWTKGYTGLHLDRIRAGVVDLPLPEH